MENVDMANTNVYDSVRKIVDMNDADSNIVKNGGNYDIYQQRVLTWPYFWWMEVTKVDRNDLHYNINLVISHTKALSINA